LSHAWHVAADLALDLMGGWIKLSMLPLGKC
jgi:hypothetical protein